jgi:YfiH family protein
MLERREASGVVWYESPLLSAAGVGHAFSTRLGGVSRGVFESLNFGNPSDIADRDPAEHIRENERRLFEASGMGGREHCRVHQVHGPAVATVRPGGAHDSDTKADAIVSDDPGRVVSVRVADCVPVLLASEDGKVVAAVHAGWRGVASGVAPAALKELRRLAPGREVIGAIGPSIGYDAFEVGPEVVEEMERAFGGAGSLGEAAKRGRDDRWHLDLRALLGVQLERAGVVYYDTSDLCTAGTPGEFFSHRRDKGKSGRMVGAIAPRAEAQRPR